MVTTIVALSTILATGVLLWWRHLDGVTRPALDTDPFAGIPIELRTAANVLTDVRHLALMWSAVGLGSAGNWPTIVGGVDLVPSGAVFEVQILGGQKLTDWTNEETTKAPG